MNRTKQRTVTSAAPKQNKQSKSKKQVSSIQSRVVAPVATSSRLRASPPRISQLGASSVTVSHREYVADLTPSTTLWTLLGSHRITPTNSALFPWLVKIARNYERYRFRSLCFDYIPRTSTSAQGSISLMVDFDPVDDPPASKAEFLNSFGAVSGPFWSEQSLQVPSQVLQSRGALFNGSAPAGTDPKTYYLGNLNIGTVGTSNTVGELYISYSVELSIPQTSLLDSYTKMTSIGGLSATNYVGANVIIEGDQGVFHVSAAPGYIIFDTHWKGTLFIQGLGTAGMDGAFARAGSATSTVSTFIYSEQATDFVAQVDIVAEPTQTFGLSMASSQPTASYWFFARTAF